MTILTTPQPTRAIALLQNYLRYYPWRTILLALLLVIGILAQLGVPQVLQTFVDATQTNGVGAETLGTALAFIILAILQRSAILATTYVGEDLGWRATNRLRRDLTGHVLQLDMGFHKTHTPGEMLERIDGDCDALRNFFSQFSLQVLSNGLLVIGILVLLLREDWRVGLGLSLYAVSVFAALLALQRITVSRWAALRTAETETVSFLEERMVATEDIRSNGAEHYALEQLAKRTDQQLQQRRRAELTANATFVGTNFLFLLGYAIGLGVGATLYSNGQATIGTAFLIVVYIGMLSGPLEAIREQVQDLQKAIASIGRIAELLRTQSRMYQTATASLPTGPLAVAFAGVTFTYDDQPTESQQSLAQGEKNPVADADAQLPALQPSVLRNISFTLEPGTTLGLLGRTGSGKSTLARLLARLYDPDTGSIQLSGIELRAIAQHDLRARVGVVTQDVQIFQASIRNNLTLFRSTISDTTLEQALGELGLLEWVRALPAGLDTQLGPGGLGLSAGEAQLLAFARVFLNNPGLVIMDEASSRLDPATERLLERAVTHLLAGRSAIIIAHRLGTVQRSDTILILEQGQIAEFGARAKLAANPESRFSALLRVGMQEELV